MKFHGWTICIFVLIISSGYAHGQKIKSWSSPAYINLPPFKQFNIVGFNFSDIPDSTLQDWVKAEIKEQFNQVENIFTVQPDSSNLYQYDYWITLIKQVSADVIFTYAISPHYPSAKKQKQKKYLPLIQQPAKSSLWGYFTSKAKYFHLQDTLPPPLVVDVNIYDYKTLQLVWSATSAPFVSELPFPAVQKIIEKMILTAIRNKVINDDMD